MKNAISFKSKNKIGNPRGAFKTFKKNLPLLILGLPGIIFFVLFAYIPLPGIVIAFQRFKVSRGFFNNEWVGFSNFEFLFSSGNAWRITRNTIAMNAIFIILGTIASVTIALLLFEITKRSLLKLYQTVMFFPHFISIVVVSFMVYGFLAHDQGLLNRLIMEFGGEKVLWYMKPNAWWFIIPITDLWKGAGWGSILFYATLMGIEKEYYEAAAIDGATKWQMTKSISIPFLIPTLIIVTILAIGRIFYSDFGMFYQVTRNVGSLLPVTDVIDTYVFRTLTTTGNTGMAAAAGLYQSFVGFVLVITTNFIVRKIKSEDALF